MPRLSITLTDSQAAALKRIAAETGATKQSMIGLAVSAWIRENDVLPTEAAKTPVIDPYEPTPTYCEVCGARADWASFSDDGKEHYFCDKHQMADLRAASYDKEDYETAADMERFYKAHPELDWDGSL